MSWYLCLERHVEDEPPALHPVQAQVALSVHAGQLLLHVAPHVYTTAHPICVVGKNRIVAAALVGHQARNALVTQALEQGIDLLSCLNWTLTSAQSAKVSRRMAGEHNNQSRAREFA